MLGEDGALRRAVRVAFRGRRRDPTFRVRVAAVLGSSGDDRERIPMDPLDDETQRTEIIAAFREAFPDGEARLPAEGDRGEVLVGQTTVRAPNHWAAWKAAIQNLREILIETETIADPGAVWHSMELAHAEITESEHADAVARAITGQGC